VVKTLGGWKEGATRYVKAIAQNIGRRGNIDNSTATRHLFQRLAVCLQRGNALLLAGDDHTSSPPMSLASAEKPPAKDPSKDPEKIYSNHNSNHIPIIF
jgi:hypothetical protein